MKVTGHERDLGVSWSPADDVDYHHARYYSPQIGRYLATDKIPLMSKAIPQPQKWNMYTYAGGNPLVNVDVTGHYVVVAGARTKEDALDELAALQQALVEIGQGGIAKELRPEQINGEIRITAGGADLSESESSTVQLLGKAMATQTRIEMSITDRDLSAHGGGRTRLKDGSTLAIELNPAQVAQSTVPVTCTHIIARVSCQATASARRFTMRTCIANS